MPGLVLRFILGALVAAFLAFVLSHYKRLTLRQQLAVVLGIYSAVFVVLSFVPDTPRLAALGRLGWVFSTAPSLADSWKPLFAVATVFALIIAWFIPRYKAHGLGSQQGTLRRLLFPFPAAALTFDDGPSPDWTPRILEILKKHQVKATFFMVGQALEAHPEVALEVKRQGHSIGSHGWSHRPLPLLDARNLIEEIDRAEQVFTKVLGEKPKYFRPPWGFYNHRVLSELRERGYLTVLWSRSTQDWRNPGVDRILELATRGAQSGEILLLHDAGNYPGPVPTSRQQTVDAIDRLVPDLEARGFQFKNLDEMVNAWLS